MASHRIERTTEDIKRELTAIFRELKDPRVTSVFLSVVRVEVTNDLSYCTVRVSAMEGLDRAKEAVKGLKSASGYIRRELGHRLKLRHVPELIFEATDSIEYSANISRILQSLDIAADGEEADDCDTLGSAYALCLVLQQMGKRARVITTYLPDDFVFLQKNVEKQDFVAQTVVSVDVADTKLLGSNRALYEGKIDLCIDHHMTNKVMVPLRLVDGSAAANCEILYKLFQHMDICWTRDIANCLYTGISTDTGCFRYTNTTSETLRIAADIMDIGCDTAYINKVMFETKSKKRVALEREIYDTMEYCLDGRCAIIAVTLEIQRRVGVSDGELEGLASIPRQIEGVDVGITMREKAEGEFKVSVRTNGDVSASQICAELGGGGHTAAAGCTVRGTLAQAKEKLKATAARYL